MDELSLSTLFNVAGWIGVFAYINLSIVKGKLIPVDTHNKIVQMLEARIRDQTQRAQDFKEAFEISDARGDLLAKGVDKLTTIGETSNAVLNSIRDRVSG